MPPRNSHMPVTRWLGTLGGALASVAFPSGCRLCEELLTRADRLPFCDACLSSFSRIFGEVCARCGQPWANSAGNADGGTLCGECSARKFTFDAARSFGVYEGKLARAIVLLKYEQIEPLGAWYAKHREKV